jgi:hypothetical protein
MKAMRIHDYGNSGVLHYEDSPLPQMAEDDVLVRVVASSMPPRAEWDPWPGSGQDRDLRRATLSCHLQRWVFSASAAKQGFLSPERHGAERKPLAMTVKYEQWTDNQER